MDENEKSSFEELVFELMMTLVVIGHVLTMHLPLPVGIPTPASDGDWSAQDALPAIQRARVAIKDLGMDTLHVETLDAVLLDWLTALEVVAVTRLGGMTDWRHDAIDTLINRVNRNLQNFLDAYPCNEDEANDD